MKLFIIIVNYNSGNQLFEGLKVVLKSPSVNRVLVIDNNSKDNSLKNIHSLNHAEKLNIIKMKSNMGFYKALNIGIKRAFELEADAVMPLDFDLDYNFDFISKLSKVEGDIVVPVLKSNINNKWLYSYGGRINWITGTQHHHVTPTPLNRIKLLKPGNKKIDTYWYDFVSGGCTIIKTSVFQKIGLFDEDYFVYWGDADLVLRAKKAGFNILIDGRTIVHHKLEIARKSLNLNKLKISFTDNMTFIRKQILWYYKPVAYLNIILLVIKVITTVIINYSRQKLIKSG